MELESIQLWTRLETKFILFVAPNRLYWWSLSYCFVLPFRFHLLSPSFIQGQADLEPMLADFAAKSSTDPTDNLWLNAGSSARYSTTQQVRCISAPPYPLLSPAFLFPSPSPSLPPPPHHCHHGVFSKFSLLFPDFIALTHGHWEFTPFYLHFTFQSTKLWHLIWTACSPLKTKHNKNKNKKTNKQKSQ